MSRATALALAVLLGLARGAYADAAAETCSRDLGDFDRVMTTLGLSPMTLRKVEALRVRAGSACKDERHEEARGFLESAWSSIINDRLLTAPTVPELTTDACTAGLSAVEEELAGSETGELAQVAATSLIEDARRLCDDGNLIEAQDKLAMAWWIAIDE